jgi:hypothetical protein
MQDVDVQFGVATNWTTRAFWGCPIRAVVWNELQLAVFVREDKGKPQNPEPRKLDSVLSPRFAETKTQVLGYTGPSGVRLLSVVFRRAVCRATPLTRNRLLS